jgi:hypothetical protein
MNQLIANVSSVPSVRQLMALRTDLIWVSAPRNKVTRQASLLIWSTTYHAPTSAWFRLHQLADGQTLRTRAFCPKKLRKLVEQTG